MRAGHHDHLAGAEPFDVSAQRRQRVVAGDLALGLDAGRPQRAERGVERLGGGGPCLVLPGLVAHLGQGGAQARAG
ncbi:hypothetical protein GCM10025868_04900 [Angustibacter aerolatus]|uniref:Uncharacterized protein n=1 Tax=Angustibacter aerolatus TaxID=1162965 RepID=A0ABQ6JEI7_9ACTN|nr:hypothetical protein GCM10025868_04900 [Angustibacter aerolatus]